MIFAFPAGRLLLIAGIIVVGLTACGRRGPLEPPPDATAAPAEQRAPSRQQRGRASLGIVQTDDSQTALEGEASPPSPAQVADAGPADEPGAESQFPAAAPVAPAGGSRRRRPYVIPKEPFILDPLL